MISIICLMYIQSKYRLNNLISVHLLKTHKMSLQYYGFVFTYFHIIICV